MLEQHRTVTQEMGYHGMVLICPYVQTILVGWFMLAMGGCVAKLGGWEYETPFFFPSH